ncbi:unnamed protein product [Rotaria socialis]|uniref:Major facilitator superfamily (MFS) profile domain-containing protein n=1 Tax=Rotaria socialis TaxID=392032 RepID=A0A818JC79_9BILA|nr:unnamed protein product [Rotaria socialis]
MNDLGVSDNNSSSISSITGSIVQEVQVTAVDDTNDPEGKKLLRKQDWHVIPPMALLYLLSFLDRANIGQAKLNGLTESLNLSSHEYNLCVSLFFVTYAVFEIPSNLALRKFGPVLWFPIIMVAWGTVITLMGLAHSYGSLLACRLVLGACESGIFPGGCYYLSTWYTERELSRRISIFFSASALAGSFGGILAYGISKMDGVGGQEGWRWIFYLEGIITVIVGVLAYFFLHDFPSHPPSFLTKSEHKRVRIRLKIPQETEPREHSIWKEVFIALATWRLYIWALCYIGLLVPFYSLSVFSPTIIHNLGFETYTAQLLSAPPYAFAFVTTMTTAYFSDKYNRRSIFILCWLLITAVAYVILIAVQQPIIKYLAVILATGSVSPAVASCIVYLSVNIHSQEERATSLAFMISFGNIGGIISGQIYRTQDAPRFILGHAVNLGFCALGITSVLILRFSLRWKSQHIGA